eukprot:1153184-Pelagomonas_calceolata.AAC.3
MADAKGRLCSLRGFESSLYSITWWGWRGGSRAFEKRRTRHPLGQDVLNDHFRAISGANKSAYGLHEKRERESYAGRKHSPSIN